FHQLSFPLECSPFGVSDQLILKMLSKPHNGKPVMWNEAEHCFRDMPSTFRENDLAAWLNNIGTIMGQVFGCEILHLWSHRSCDTPPIGSLIERKPDLILLDKKYYEELQDPNKQTDWAFIHGFAEVTRLEGASKQMIGAINAKLYLMFLCQFDQRFALALLFTSDEAVQLTVTDREGQICWNMGLKSAQ
ncbi:hypothetical protein BYT27DRAFT_7088968, partial [Phlegmacium glaucopus]